MDQQLRERRAAERWFLDRGLPSVVTRRARLRSLWPRSAPVLAGFAVLDACTLAVYVLTGDTDVEIIGDIGPTETAVLVILALAIPLAWLAGWLVARMRSDRAETIVATSAVALVAALWVIERVRRDVSVRREIAGVLLEVSVIAVVLLLTAAGIGSVIGWAVRLTWAQLSATGTLLIRSLPVVLLTALVFFNTYIWVMAALITQTRFWLALFFLVALATVFVVSGTMEPARPVLEKATASARHEERLVGTPFENMPAALEADPLTRGERINVVFVLAASQLAQIAAAAAVTAGIFFVLGLIVVSPEILAAWTRTGSADGSMLGVTVPVPQALMYMTLFLGALTFMYVSAKSVGDGEYRSQFLDPLIDDLKLTLVARNRYRHDTLAQPVV
jgi:hypothetical protein